MIEYRDAEYFVWNGQKKVAVTPLLVVGKAVEACWRNAYRPGVHKWPVPLGLQGAADISSVTFSNVWRRGPGVQEVALGRQDFRVYEDDAALALQVAREVMAKFVASAPYFFQVLTVDHAAGGVTQLPTTSSSAICQRARASGWALGITPWSWCAAACTARGTSTWAP